MHSLPLLYHCVLPASALDSYIERACTRQCSYVKSCIAQASGALSEVIAVQQRRPSHGFGLAAIPCRRELRACHLQGKHIDALEFGCSDAPCWQSGDAVVRLSIWTRGRGNPALLQQLPCLAVDHLPATGACQLGARVCMQQDSWTRSGEREDPLAQTSMRQPPAAQRRLLQRPSSQGPGRPASSTGGSHLPHSSTRHHWSAPAPQCSPGAARPSHCCRRTGCARSPPRPLPALPAHKRTWLSANHGTDLSSFISQGVVLKHAVSSCKETWRHVTCTCSP